MYVFSFYGLIFDNEMVLMTESSHAPNFKYVHPMLYKLVTSSLLVS